MRADAQRNRARILAAAATVYAERGAAASTEDVAARAGVAIGTVFRHFPTKRDLQQAIMKDVLRQLSDDVEALVRDGDPATALLDFLGRTVRQAASARSVAEALEIRPADAVRALEHGVGALLERAGQAGAVRADVRIDEVMALLTALCQSAVSAGWTEDLQRRTLTTIAIGLGPSPG